MDKTLFPIPKAFLRHHQSSLEGFKLPPVLLLTGIAGVGKRTLAHYIAQWIFCKETASRNLSNESPTLQGLPCEECIACKQALSGNWVDFTEVLPEETGGALKAEQLRELKTKLGFGGFDHAYKIILIPNAERMTPQAANSILKILEEPPTGWIFILTSNDPTLLLPTIVSRCQILRLKPFPISILQELLKESGVKEKEKQTLCAELAHGSWGRALALADEKLWKYREDILEFSKNPVASVNSLTDWAAQSVENIDFLMSQLENICYQKIQNATSRYPWIERAEKIAQARQHIHLPINKKLLVQGLLLPWVETA